MIKQGGVPSCLPTSPVRRGRKLYVYNYSVSSALRLGVLQKESKQGPERSARDAMGEADHLQVARALVCYIIT